MSAKNVSMGFMRTTAAGKTPIYVPIGDYAEEETIESSASALLLGKKYTFEIEKFIKQLRAGLPAKSIDLLRKALDLDKLDPLAKNLGVSVKTLNRRLQEQKPLDARTSDRLYRLAAVFEQAVSSLGSQEVATEWLFSKNPGLGGDRPWDRLDTEIGVEHIKNLLIQIEYGLIS